MCASIFVARVVGSWAHPLINSAHDSCRHLSVHMFRVIVLPHLLEVPFAKEKDPIRPQHTSHLPTLTDMHKDPAPTGHDNPLASK